jgi:type II secretory pathway pseudopilin PulG
MKTTTRAFTLIELLIVTAIIIVIATSALVITANWAEKKFADAEDRVMESIREDIVRSFESEDFATQNILAVTGALPNGTTVTQFSQHNLDGSVSVSDADWFSKVARVRGLSVTATASLTNTNQPELFKIAFNKYGRPRALFAAPAEADKQRFMLVSLMQRTEILTMPAFQSTQAWFDAIFTNNWNTQRPTLPSSWTSTLNAAQATAWTGDSGGSNLWRLRVITFTVPKHSIHISNGHPTDTLYVTTDGGGSVYTVAPGATADPTAFSGRTVRVYQGSLTNPVSRTFVIRKASDVIVE